MKKTTNQRRIRVRLMLAALFCAAGSVFADTRIFSVPMGTAGDWNVNANWTGGLVPVAADLAYIRDGRTAIVTNDVGTIKQMFIGGLLGSSDNSGAVNIQSGKLISLLYSDVGRRAQTAGAVGTLRISGGTFQSGDSAGSEVVSIGGDLSATGLLEVSGTGTFVGRAIIGSNDTGDSNDVFRIIGSNVTVGNTSTAGQNSLEFRESGSLEFVFDAAGIATASFQEVVTFATGSPGIVVDGSAYTGGAATFTLLEAGTISATAPPITLVGFASGTTYSWNSTTDEFSVTVPEPVVTRVFDVPADTAGDWHVATNWTEHLVPVAFNKVYIRDGRTANISTDVGTILQMYIGDLVARGVNGTVNMTAGKLVSSDVSEVGRRIADANGILSISGGTFQSGDSEGSQVILVGVDGADYHTTGLLEISGTGTFIGRALVGSNEAGDSNDVFRITGSNVTVGNSSEVGVNSLEFRDSGSLEFVFDADGIATATFQEIVTFSAGSAGIVVDGSAYAGTNQTFTLLAAGALASTEPAIELVGFGAGATYDWDTVNDIFTVSAVAPPPPLAIGEIGIAVDSSNAVVSWLGMTGATYTLQSKTDLVEQLSWSNAVPGITGIDGSMSATSTVVAVESFYRVIAE